MQRFLFIGLAFVAGILAVLFGWTWLYLVAGVLLVIAGVILLTQARKQYGSKSAGPTPGPDAANDLRAHGILEVRPKARRESKDVIRWPTLESPPKTPPPPALAQVTPPKAVTPKKAPPAPVQKPPAPSASTDSYAPVPAAPPPVKAPDAPAQDTPPPPPARTVSADAAAAQPQPEAPKEAFAKFVSAPEGYIAPADQADAPTDAEEPPAADQAAEPVPAAPPAAAPAATPEKTALVTEALTAQLEALKVSLGAHTVVMMMVDQAASTYRVQAAISETDALNRDGTFTFDNHFLSDLEPRTYVLQVGEDVGEDELTYYTAAVPVGEILVSPVKLGGDMAGFLLCDRLKGAESFSDDERFVAKESAYLLGFMLDLHHGAKIMRWNPRLVPIRKQSVRQIIGEEMTEARRQGYPLGLALVFLDEGETIIRKGKEALNLAEQQLRSRLARTISNGRIEHFGQLGFGIFHYADVPEVEQWIDAALESFTEPDPILDGDLMIGVAMLQEKHEEPTDLQIAAGRALHEAYRTGESTIIVD